MNKRKKISQHFPLVAFATGLVIIGTFIGLGTWTMFLQPKDEDDTSVRIIMPGEPVEQYDRIPKAALQTDPTTIKN